VIYSIEQQQHGRMRCYSMGVYVTKKKRDARKRESEGGREMKEK